MKKKIDVINIIVNIIIIILSILVIYWLIQFIIGKSPNLSEINFTVILLIITFLFKINREIGEIKTGIKYSFINIKNDINLIKKKLKIK